MSARQQDVIRVDRSLANSKRRTLNRAALTACARVEWLESRRLLTGTPVPISMIPNIYNSVEAPMTISTNTIMAGQTLTVNIDNLLPGMMTIACTQASAVTVDGVAGGGEPFPDVYEYGSSTIVQPAPDKSATGPFGAGVAPASTEIGSGSHTVVFTISPDAATEGQTETSEEENPDGYPYLQSFYNGPWVVAEGQATSSNYSSAQAFDITAGKYLTPVITHNTLPASFITSDKRHDKEVVKITNFQTVKDTLDKTIIYASYDGLLDGEAYPIGEVDKTVPLNPGKSTTITVPVNSLNVGQLQGSYQLVAAVYDTAGLPGITTNGPSINVSQPVVSMVPSAVTVVTAHNGSDTVHFTLTNTGNVTSTGHTAFEFSYFPSNYNGYAGYLDYKSVRVILAPKKSRRMAIGLTAAQVLELKAGLPVHLDVVVSEYESASVLINL